MKIAKVIFPFTVDKEFDYLLCGSLKISVGMRVLVDFKGKKHVGVVSGLAASSRISKLKPVISVLDGKEVLTAEHFRFARSLAKIYPYPFGEFVFMMLPRFLHKPQRTDMNLPPSRASADFSRQPVFIKGTTFGERYSAWKEEVSRNLETGSVFICFPQVSYLAAAKEIVAGDFGDNLKVITSQAKNINDIWSTSRSHSLILGTRAALFYYPRDLGLIVVEEEDSPYYFQEEKPFYNLADVCLCLAALKKIQLIFSSGFLTLKTFRLVKEGKMQFNEHGESKYKKINVIDTAGFYKKKLISPVAVELLRLNLEGDKQTVVIWNKRSYALSVICSNCGYVVACDRCSSFLKVAYGSQSGRCPYCGKVKEIPKLCMKCGKGYLKMLGVGIERLEKILQDIFPYARTSLWRVRQADSKIIFATSEIISSLYSGEKFDTGLVMDIDALLSRPDYDAAWRAFIYLKKLSMFFKDCLYVFTSNPRHYLFEYLNRPWQDFYEKESALRREFMLPPYTAMARLTLRHPDKNKLFTNAVKLYNQIKEKDIEIYGPLEDSPFRLRGNFRYCLIIKRKSRKLLHSIIKGAIGLIRKNGIKIAAVIE